MRRGILGGLVVALAVAAVGMTVGGLQHLGPGQASAASPNPSGGASADSASSFQIRGNASGPAVFHAAFEVSEPTECEIHHRYHVTKEAVLYNGTGVSQVWVEDGTFTGWARHQSPTLVQVHAGEQRYRSDAQSEFYDPEGDVYVLDDGGRPYRLVVEDRLRISVAAEHWAVPDAPNSSLELPVECQGPVSPPEQVETVQRTHLVDQDTAEGGAGAAVNSLVDPGVNLLDEGSFETSQRRIEAYEGIFCLGGAGYGTTWLDTPRGEQRWRMNGLQDWGYRHEGPPGAYAYTVTWVDQGCHWWLGLWPTPGEIGAG